MTTTSAAQPAALDKSIPQSIRELQEIEDYVQQVAAKVMPATVCLRVGDAQGSGVIVDRDGRILTAAHVTRDAGRDVTIIFHDGRRAHGKTLGANQAMDSGMAILTETVDFVHAPLAKSGEFKRGQWCVGLGHPNGYKRGRPPVVRLGRVQACDAGGILTDCTLVGGDSGGPLFDLNGRVIGIHSRIGSKLSANVHVPIDTFHETWPRLAAGDVWGEPFPFAKGLEPPAPYLGLRATEDRRTLRVEMVTAGSPADKAGLKKNDVIHKVNDRAFQRLDDFTDFVRGLRPGSQISVQVQRGGETITIAVTLGKSQP